MVKYKNVKVIDCSDWDALVQETYGKPYNFQQQDGCKSRGIENIAVPMEDYEDMYSNDIIAEVINNEDEMGVSFSSWLARDPETPLNPTDSDLKDCGYYWGKSDEDKEKWKIDKHHIELFWERNFYPDVQMVANDLYKRGLIEAGMYSINIDW